MMPYSPKLNLVEYIIHLIRQKALHHADHKLNLEDFEKKIKDGCKKGKTISQEQIVNILEHIETLVPKLSIYEPKGNNSSFKGLLENHQ